MNLPRKWSGSSTGKTLVELADQYGVSAERIEFYAGFPAQFFSTLRMVPNRPYAIQGFSRKIAVGFAGAVEELTRKRDDIEESVYRKIKTAVEEDVSLVLPFHG